MCLWGLLTRGVENFLAMLENFLWFFVGNCGELCTFEPNFKNDPGEMTRFIGNCDAKMDEKGRVFFPAAFRRLLAKDGDEALMIRKDVHQNCLVLYPKSVWNRQLDTLRGRLNRWNRQQQMVFRQFVAGVDELPIDGNGRILIPSRLRQQVNLEAAVRFIGMDDVIELWSQTEVEALLEPADGLGESLEALLGGDDLSNALGADGE